MDDCPIPEQKSILINKRNIIILLNEINFYKIQPHLFIYKIVFLFAQYFQIKRNNNENALLYE